VHCQMIHLNSGEVNATEKKTKKKRMLYFLQEINIKDPKW